PDPMPGADPGLPHVLTPKQACAGKQPPGRHVLVYDTDGYYVAPGVAELLARDGFAMSLITTFDVLSPVSDQTLEDDMLRAHLHRAGVRVRTATTITAIGTRSVIGHNRHGDPWSAACDGIVLVTQQAPHDSLYAELASDPQKLAAAGISGLYCIGDAVAPRMTSEPTRDGHRPAPETAQKAPPQPPPSQRERAHLPYPGTPPAIAASRLQAEPFHPAACRGAGR